MIAAPAWLGATGCVWANGVLLRTLHHWAAVPFHLDAMWRSTLVQAAFSVFWAALAPSHLRPIYGLMAIAFVVWKSPVAQPAIDAWNAASPYDIARIVEDIPGVEMIDSITIYDEDRRVAVDNVRLEAHELIHLVNVAVVERVREEIA